MKDKLRQIEGRLDSLRAEMRAAGMSILVLGEKMRDGDEVPDQAVIGRLQKLRERHANVARQVLQFAGDLGLPMHIDPQSATLNGLGELLKLCRVALDRRAGAEEARRNAVSIVEQVLGIVHADEPEFPALRDCHARAQALRQDLLAAKQPDQHPELRALLEKQHPFSYLLELIATPDNDDKQWELLHHVANTLGRPLALAASRGRLQQASARVPVIGGAVESAPEATKDESEPEMFGALPDESEEVSSGIEPAMAAPEEAPQTPPPAEEPVTLPAPAGAAPAIEQVVESVLREARSSQQEPEPEGVASPPAAPAPDIQLEAAPFVYESPASSAAIDPSTDSGEWITFLRGAALPAETLPRYGFAHELTAREIAAAIDPDDPAALLGKLPDLIWRLLAEDQVELAYHFAAALSYGPQHKPMLPPWLMRCLILSRHLRHAHGELADSLKREMGRFSEACFIEGDDEWNEAMRLLLTAASLQPTILAPMTKAVNILQDLRYESFSRLYEYAKTISSYGKSYSSITLSALKVVKDGAAWQKEMDALLNEVDTWYAQAPRQIILYQPSTRVWQMLVNEGGLLYNFLDPVRRDDATALEAVRSGIAQWSDADEIEDVVHYIDRQVLGRRGGEDITARSLNQLIQHTYYVATLANRWVALHDASPGRTKDFSHKQAEALCRNIRTLQDGVREELDQAIDKETSPLIRAGLVRCAGVIGDVSNLFDPEAPLSLEEPSAREVLQTGLLRFSSVGLDDNWRPNWGRAGQHIVRDLLGSLVRPEESGWLAMFAQRMAKGDHEGTLQMIDYLATHPEAGVDVEELQVQRDRNIKELQLTYKREIGQTRNQIEDAVMFGYLRESERHELIAGISELEEELPDLRRFDRAQERLQAVRTQIDRRRAAEIDRVRQRLHYCKEIPNGSADFLRISELLDRGDALTANEYIQLASDNQPLPELLPEPSAFSRFFPEMFHKIEQYLEPSDQSWRFDVRGIVKALEQYARGRQSSFHLGPVDLIRVKGGQATQVAAMLEAWFSLKRARAITLSSLETVLIGLGFSNPRLQMARASMRPWLDLTCDPIQDREICPISFYGSEAEGHYRILCVWDRPTEEDLLNQVGDAYHGSPVIVFHFGRLTVQRRRLLARLSRERRRTFIVLDDVLLLYLCGERSPRLSAFFACTLPFTHVQPYRTAAGVVPPEMFFGREHELNSVIDPTGTCFIYGGRQVGKTALLRAVERKYHNPGEGMIVRWIDLKSEGIGERRSIDEIFPLIARELKTFEVLPKNLSDQNPDKIIDGAISWLEADPRRRILLLLDEADRFLESDGKERFVRCSRLKGLMDKRDRQFKIVFAGLHNVQRTTRQENHPLAHFGEPLCIGPLLENGEIKEARKLVEFPMESVGYVFDSGDLATRILSLTNYYPSLIQLYCAQLLRHVTSPHAARFESRFDTRKIPPCTLRAEDVEDATRSQNLLKDIRDRFMWTLQLDGRYEVIAYVIAYGFLDHFESEVGNTRSFPLGWIRKKALGLWPEGFRESSDDYSFRVLLDEMVGLGILRSTSVDHYTLRSPNVVSLMGTSDEIESVLLRDRELPPPYEAATFRAAYRVDPLRRSPLTDQQESDLRRWENGASIILGCDAAGLSEVGDFLRAADKEYFKTLEPGATSATFETVLNDLKRREEDGTTILLIPADCQWDAAWIHMALRKVANLNRARESRSVNSRFVRFAFLADPRQVWRMVGELDELRQRGVGFIQLRPWQDAALRQWLDDCGYRQEKHERVKFTARTGNWPILLYHVLRELDQSREALEARLEELEKQLGNPAFARQWRPAFGLDVAEPVQVLTDMAVLDEPVTIADLAGVMSIPQARIQCAIEWADKLNLIHLVADGRWQLDPVVGRILSVTG